MSYISKRILDIIIAKGISYGELSEMTGIPKSALQRYATGQTEKIPIDRLEKIAIAIGTTAAYLMGWDAKTTNKPGTQDVEHDILEDVDVAFFGNYKELNETHKETIRAMARVLKEQEEKDNR